MVNENLLRHSDNNFYYQYLYFFAVRKINDSELAKDLVQETFLAAIEGRSKFKGESSELTWLTAILKYKIFRIFRKRTSNKISYSDTMELVFISESLNIHNKLCNSTRLDEIVYTELMAALSLFVGTLPLKWQELYDLKYVRFEAPHSICEQLSLSRDNYYVISHRLNAAVKNWYLNTWSIY